MQFIKLTLDDDDRVYYINTQHIISLIETRQGTKVAMINDDIVFVQETPEQIIKLIESEKRWYGNQIYY